MKRRKLSSGKPSEHALVDLEQVWVIPVTDQVERRRFQRSLRKDHDLGRLKAVGEQLYYVAMDAQRQWLALPLFSAAARHFKHRDQWIRWTRVLVRP